MDPRYLPVTRGGKGKRRASSRTTLMLSEMVCPDSRRALLLKEREALRGAGISADADRSECICAIPSRISEEDCLRDCTPLPPATTACSGKLSVEKRICKKGAWPPS